jgi:hypothetical protein
MKFAKAKTKALAFRGKEPAGPKIMIVNIKFYYRTGKRLSLPWLPNRQSQKLTFRKQIWDNEMNIT